MLQPGSVRRLIRGYTYRTDGSRLAHQAAVVAGAFAALEVTDTHLFPHRVPQGELVFGCLVGLTYALLAIALILVYKANRIINFAVAEFGVFGAIVFQNLQGEHLPWFASLLAGITSAGAAGFVMERFLARRFARSSRLILSVATIGMAQFVAFGEIEVARHFGTIPASGGLRTPLSDFTFVIGGATFDGNAILLAVVAVATLIALEVFLHRSAYGIALRAAAENAPRAALLGIPVKKVSTLAWVIAAVIAGIATVLHAPMTGVIAGGTVVGPTLLYKSLAVAVIADFSDLRVAVLAGLLLGMVGQSITYAYSGSPITDAMYIAVIIAVLLARCPQVGRIVDAAASSWKTISEVRRIPRSAAREPRVVSVRAGAVISASVLLVAGPLGLSGTYRFDASDVLVFALVAISCVVVTGCSGQISLGQFALAAVGAVTSGKLFAQAHWDFFASINPPRGDWGLKPSGESGLGP